MKVTKVARREAKALFAACIIGGIPDETRVKSAVSVVLAKKPRGYMGILHHFQRLVKLDLVRRTAKVESAIELSAEQKSSVEKKLAGLYPEGLLFNFEVNRLGGLRCCRKRCL